MLRVLPTGAKHWVWRETVRWQAGGPGTRKLARAGGDPRALRTAAPTFADALEKVLAIQRSVLAAGKPGAPSKYQLGPNQPSPGGVRSPCGALWRGPGAVWSGSGGVPAFAGPGPEGHSLLSRISWSSAHVSRPSSSRHRMTPSMRTRSSSTIPS